MIILGFWAQKPNKWRSREEEEGVVATYIGTTLTKVGKLKKPPWLITN